MQPRKWDRRKSTTVLCERVLSPDRLVRHIPPRSRPTRSPCSVAHAVRPRSCRCVVRRQLGSACLTIFTQVGVACCAASFLLQQRESAMGFALQLGCLPLIVSSTTSMGSTQGLPARRQLGLAARSVRTGCSTPTYATATARFLGVASSRLPPRDGVFLRYA